MLHAKFQDHRTSGSGEEDFYINFLSHCPRRHHMKFGIDWPSGFREEDV